MPVLPNSKSRKYPLLAALFNFFVPGLGYAYNARRNLFAFLLLLSVVLFWIVSWYLLSTELPLHADKILWPAWTRILDEMSYFIASLAFAIDAFDEAKNLNKENGHS